VAHPLAGYQPRVAEHGVLYRVIDEHLETFLDAAAHDADIDVLACPRCGGRLRLLGTIEDPVAIRAILDHLAASAEGVDRAPPLGTREPAALPAQV
jgi:hypothetical protein